MCKTLRIFYNFNLKVISQYNEKCCPLKTGNVHCANGENTQGENIADIGGQYAAYNAYRRYIRTDRNGVEEDLLPGMESYTGNQIFWITYGFSWCMKQTNDSLAHQLLTNEHAPGFN
jgi:predicted metalloendopeptidase